MKNFLLGVFSASLFFCTFFAWCPYGRELILNQTKCSTKSVDCQIRILFEQEQPPIKNSKLPGDFILENEKP